MIPGSSSTLGHFEDHLAGGFFARHETFCPRYGWLKKGFDGVLGDPLIFDSPDAIERLGVGKNMVRSIRFWCVAFHLIEPDIESGPRRLGGPMRVTRFGGALLSDDGWDPFLEDPASLWLLHWQLFSIPISATTWSLAINLGYMGSFALKEFGQALIERKDSYPTLTRYNNSSVEKDASCFIRMYAPPGERVSDEIECPFTDLGLLAPSDEKQAFRFNMADKNTLPEEIFLAACCDYALKTQSSKALSLNKVSYDFNAPGVVFKLSESDVGYRLEEASQKFGEDVRFVELYGQRQIQFDRDPQEVYRRMLREKDKYLARELYHVLGKRFARTSGLFRVAVTSSFESINRTLANGLRRALLDLKRRLPESRRDLPGLISRAEELCTQTMPETPRLMELFQSIRKAHGTPIALVIDEFGKNLEYMARFPAQGDLFVLQALAETEGIYLWVCLHQAFEEYTSRLSARQLQEWGKIQGRFEDTSFVEPKSEMIQFICETLARKNNDVLIGRAVRAWAEYYREKAMEHDLPELRDLDVNTIERFFPLHPLTAVVLPELCVRFAQNDRTLFAFLCSGEPSALPAYLAVETIDPGSRRIPTFGLERLYDYFLSYSSTALMNRPELHRWIEIHDIIERSRSIDPFELSVLKVIGLLNLISGPSRFRSSDRLVSFAFLRPQPSVKVAEQDLRKAIQENVEKGVLIYREYADEYRLWEGTDFDIPAAVRERKALLATQSLDVVLKETLPLAPLTASKHSYVTGTLRHYERRWCSFSQLAEEAAHISAREMDGLILYCYGREQELSSPPSRTEDGRPVIVCYTASEDQIRDVVVDAAAAKAVLKDSPELAHDGVARKEARFRAHAAEE